MLRVNTRRNVSFSMWTGIIDDHLVDRYLWSDCLAREKYFFFPEKRFPNLLRLVPFITFTQMWFVHNGNQPQLPANIRLILNITFPWNWLGESVTWTDRSQDINVLDFFFWGENTKSVLHESPIDSAEDLVAKIVVATNEINTTGGIFMRVR